MGSIEDYSSGTILGSIRRVVDVLNTVNMQPLDEKTLVRVKEKIRAFEPVCLSLAEASIFIRNARVLALGERVCRPLHPGSPSTRSVFLDELAEAMIRSGLAEPVTAEDAESSLDQNPGHPLIISMVSGRHQEICASHQPDCVYWLAEKHGLHCLKRRLPG
jgi:hypothetical protein